ncbi:interactor of constitutive active ROPs 2, chloroplastic isoform X1 [Aegilops tauschii subsp. strangulata]|uniref:Interactor of constitutive active ROPs 2, chloroplastic n=2 Tax=Triticinae TaxID=1648030 RepID=A0A453FVD3_AEGTS|nr:interactor of constitutive active ROPs 2, chloroplastic isoform X3 [Aegilops tauschii subsp. strangulata]XP_044358384.1 interactor of constitutive active ROPs 2, chloroplastic-like isoform X1 [Triticum aestivum]XP_044358385.1 interactor of constitutive active ROPs 2, chloroplastic-like isoform X1 [Triticum aestivum]XP_044358386.1 interactor of constitutive active ROPs 2, chloroplastic-like isoform X1 [Triticum aestivum]
MLYLSKMHFLRLYSSSTAVRNGSVEHPARGSPLGANKTGRPTRLAGLDSGVDAAATKSPTGRSPKVERRTTMTAEREKRRSPMKLSELESQLSQLQDELKKAKEQLHSSENSRKRALQEAEEARAQAAEASAQASDSRAQLAELSSVEETRIFELRRLSQERDRSWQSELEAMQKQHEADSAALVAAMGEVHRLRVQLAAAARADRKQEVAEALATVDELRAKLTASEEAEAQARALHEECKQQLEASRATIDSLLTDGSKLMDSFSLVVTELEESRAKLKALEEEVEETTSAKAAAAGQSCNCSDSEAAELRSALEDVEARFQEEKILSTVETQCAYELMDQIKVESDLRHGKLATALASAKSEVMFLKASLFDRESELRRAQDATKKAQDDARTNSTADELKAQLQGALQENGQLKLELRQYESEKVPAKSEADAAAEAAKKGETEAELRRLRVQAEQWRKAAETAMALLTVGKGGNGKILDRGESLDGGKYAGLYDELDDDAAAARKNGNVLRRISGMWKK